MKPKNAVVGTKVVHKEYGYKGKIVRVTKDHIGNQLLIVEWESCSGVGFYYAMDLKKVKSNEA